MEQVHAPTSQARKSKQARTPPFSLWCLPPLVAILPAVLLVLRLLRKEVYLVALGAYGTFVRGLLQLVARLAQGITVRDVASLKTLSSGWARGLQPVLVRDPA